MAYSVVIKKKIKIYSTYFNVSTYIAWHELKYSILFIFVSQNYKINMTNKTRYNNL